MLPKLVQPWLPYPITLRSDENDRAPWNLQSVVDSLQVSINPRYTPRDMNGDGKRETFCNIFLWDFTSAMGAEIPHWVDEKGAPCKPGKGAELSANKTVDWILKHGKRFGWSEVTEKEARECARLGKPAVALWKNPKGIGHVAVVMPAREPSTLIAQAGSLCFSLGPITKGFGKASPRFFAHP